MANYLFVTLEKGESRQKLQTNNILGADTILLNCGNRDQKMPPKMLIINE
jgi:hypothetical protein